MSLTEEAKQQYIKDGGVKCPKCGCDTLDGEEVEVNGGKAHQRVWCTDCDAEWIDEYTLTGIIEQG